MQYNIGRCSLPALLPLPPVRFTWETARTFLVNWLLARQKGWRIILRVEDLDGPRIKSGSDQLAMEDLLWLGLDWDQGPIYQTARAKKYEVAIKSLVDSGLAYACICSRKEVEQAASAPHGEDGSFVYPGTCRGRFASIEDAREQAGKPPALRFAVPDGVVSFEVNSPGRGNSMSHASSVILPSPRLMGRRRTNLRSWSMMRRWE